MKIGKDKLRTGATTARHVATRDATINLFKFIRIIGIKMPRNKKFAYIVYASVINGLSMIVMPILFTISYTSPGSDTNIGSILTSLQCGINVYGVAVKVAIMALMLKQLRKAEMVMAKLDARCVTEDEQEKIRKVVKIGNRIVLIFWSIYVAYVTSTFLAAIISGAPPYGLSKPLVNWRKSTTHCLIAFAMEYVLINITCKQQVVMDAYAVLYISVLRRHVQILLVRISKLGCDPTKTKEENTEELVNCIVDHKNIIELFDILHTVISKTILVQFLFTAAILGTTLINLLIFADFSSKVASLSYILAVVVEILPCCYYAECLMVESGQFGNAIFHSNWIDQDVKYRKMLVFCIQQSQKPIVFTAGKIFPINLNSFIGIAKFSFTLYTFIRQMGYAERYQN